MAPICYMEPRHSSIRGLAAPFPPWNRGISPSVDVKRLK